MKRMAHSSWEGGPKTGTGTVSTESGMLMHAGYSYCARFEHDEGTNPEELVGAALATCFSMALSGYLGEIGVTAERLETTATVSLDKTGDGYAIRDVHISVKATIPNLDREEFQEIAAKTKENCPISKLLRADVTLDACLEKDPPVPGNVAALVH